MDNKKNVIRRFIGSTHGKVIVSFSCAAVIAAVSIFAFNPQTGSSVVSASSNEKGVNTVSSSVNKTSSTVTESVSQKVLFSKRTVKSKSTPSNKNKKVTPSATTKSTGKNLAGLAQYGTCKYLEGVAWTNAHVRKSGHFDCNSIVKDIVAQYKQHGYTLQTSIGNIYLCNDGMGDIMLRGRCSGHGQSHIIDVGVICTGTGYIKEGSEIVG